MARYIGAAVAVAAAAMIDNAVLDNHLDQAPTPRERARRRPGRRVADDGDLVGRRRRTDRVDGALQSRAASTVERAAAAAATTHTIPTRPSVAS